MRRFWIDDEFIDNYAKSLSLKAQMVYVCLCRHANGEGKTTIGCRRIAKKLGISKNTVNEAIKELQVSQLLGRRVNAPSQSGYYTVPILGTHPSQSVGHKEVGSISKEGFKNSSRTDLLLALQETKLELTRKLGYVFK